MEHNAQDNWIILSLCHFKVKMNSTPHGPFQCWMNQGTHFLKIFLHYSSFFVLHILSQRRALRSWWFGVRSTLWTVWTEDELWCKGLSCCWLYFYPISENRLESWSLSFWTSSFLTQFRKAVENAPSCLCSWYPCGKQKLELLVSWLSPGLALAVVVTGEWISR